MRKYSPAALSASATTFLSDRQTDIDGKVGHISKAERARQLFGAKDNAAFREVLKNLAAAAPGGPSSRGYCFYCEHDRKAAIEHTYPLRHYPEKSHQYRNFLLACNVCNSDKKSDRFAVFVAGGPAYTEFDYRSLGKSPPPAGDAVLLDLRVDDPTKYLQLDLSTGVFLPIAGLPASEAARADYTIRAVGLNDDALPRRRMEYVDMYFHRLRLLADALLAGNQVVANRMVAALTDALHPTVLFELRRQQTAVPGLPPIFAIIPPHIGA